MAKPDFYWIVLFKKLEPGESRGDLGPGPDLKCVWVDDRSKLRFLGVLKLAHGEDWTWRWRDLVCANGPGDYEILQYLDEALTKPAGLNYYGRSPTYEEDIEGWRLYPKDWTLTDAQVADLEHGLAGAIAVGNAAPAEALSVFYERAERWEDVLRVCVAGLRAPDHDHGIWEFYDESARPLRNMQRRLSSRCDRARSKVRGKRVEKLYNTIDCGESDPRKNCEKCGKVGALAADYAIGSVMLCYGCRVLPRDQWPKPKSLNIPVFSGFKPFTSEERAKRGSLPPKFELGTPGVTFKHWRTCSRVSGGTCHSCGGDSYFGYGSGEHGDQHVVLCKKCLAKHEELAGASEKERS